MRLWILILGMALVTYIPRMLPMVGLKGMRLPSRISRFLCLVPIAALTSLTFPYVLNATGSIQSALAGCLAAAALAFLRLNIILVVLGAILAVLLWESLAPVQHAGLILIRHQIQVFGLFIWIEN